VAEWDFNELSGEEAPASFSGGSFDWKAVPYEVRGLLGQGGMGAVYRAYDPAARREVALKVMRQDSLSKAALARFRQEGEIAASLTHPNVLQIHGVWEVPPHTALVYELIEGARAIDEAWGQDLRERVRLIRDAARGVAAAHARGVVHRDLKPDNLLVDAKGRVRVTDFGIAYADRADRLTKTGAMVGTPVYMAPEQFHRKDKPSPASDVWALGVLLFVALSDELPFPGPDFGNLITQVRDGATSQILSRLTTAPPELVAVVRGALRPKPADRFPDATVLADTLDAWLEGRPSGSGGGLKLAAGGLLLVVGVVLASILASRGGPDSNTGSSSASASASSARVAEAAESSTPGSPPAELLTALEDTEGAHSGLAALELKQRWPEGDHAEAVRLRLERLQREPLVKLYARLPPKTSKKDWEVAFEPDGRGGYTVLGLADKCGIYARWNLASGELASSRVARLSWSLSGLFEKRGLAIPRSESGLFVIDLVGSEDYWLIPYGAEPRVLSMNWPPGEVCWVLGRERLYSYRADGTPLRSYPLPHSTEQGHLEPAGAERIFVSLGDEESGRSEFWSLSLETGTWGRLFQMPGVTPKTVYHPGSDTLLAATNESALVVLARGRKQVFPRRPDSGGFRTLALEFRGAGETFWSYGHPKAGNNPCWLELNRVRAGKLEVLASRTISVATGSASFSPCGRFLAIGHARDPERRQAAEVWYLGPEVLPPIPR
jgi:serine/threonine protein kinase